MVNDERKNAVVYVKLGDRGHPDANSPYVSVLAAGTDGCCAGRGKTFLLYCGPSKKQLEEEAVAPGVFVPGERLSALMSREELIELARQLYEWSIGVQQEEAHGLKA